MNDDAGTPTDSRLTPYFSELWSDMRNSLLLSCLDRGTAKGRLFLASGRDRHNMADRRVCYLQIYRQRDPAELTSCLER